MKKLLLFLIVIFMLCIIAAILAPSINEKSIEVKPGQVWIKEYNLENPYEEVTRDTLTIIDKSGDYVLYVESNGDTSSIKNYWIPVNGRLYQSNE